METEKQATFQIELEFGSVRFFVEGGNRGKNPRNKERSNKTALETRLELGSLK